jgi:hypothetical protein
MTSGAAPEQASQCGGVDQRERPWLIEVAPKCSKAPAAATCFRCQFAPGAEPLAKGKLHTYARSGRQARSSDRYERVARSVAPATTHAAAIAGATPTVVARTRSATTAASPAPTESRNEYRTKTAATRRSSFIGTLLRGGGRRLPAVGVIRACRSARATRRPPGIVRLDSRGDDAADARPNGPWPVHAW